MTGCINQIELIFLAIIGTVEQAHTLRLDGNTPLPLDIHGIEHLTGHLSFRKGPTETNELIGEGRLTMIYVCNNGKIAYILLGSGHIPEAQRKRGQVCSPTPPDPQQT